MISESSFSNRELPHAIFAIILAYLVKKCYYFMFASIVFVVKEDNNDGKYLFSPHDSDVVLIFSVDKFNS